MSTFHFLESLLNSSKPPLFENLPCTKEIHVGWEIQRPFWLVLNWAFSDVKNKEIKLRKESLFIVSSDLQNFRSWNSKGISSVLSSRNLAARERAMHCILVKRSVLWLIPFPQAQFLSKSTVVALYSLLVWLKFISVHSTRMKALLLCGIGLVFKLASLQ